MKLLKRTFILFVFFCFLPMIVHAGSLRFNTPEKVSNMSYKFTLTVQDIDLNMISGNISITNGTISKIEMSSGWINKTGISNQFYFYHDGIHTGDYVVATIYVTMTGNSEYSVSNVNYKANKCMRDIYGTYFSDVGNVVNESIYNSVCGKSKDATLKSLSLSSGTLSPNFSSSLELYSATVENSVSAITFYPVTNHNKAKVISGVNCSLNVGVNYCKLVVQAESGDTKTYSITVMRKGSSTSGGTLSNDASIRNLTVTNGTLTTAFNSSKTEYDVKVGRDVSKIAFSFVMNSNGQSMRSNPCPITPDTARCKLTVTAEDGVSTKTYTFNILHEGSAGSNSGNNTENNVIVIPPNNSSDNYSKNNSNNSNSNNNNSSNEGSLNFNNSSDTKLENEHEDKNLDADKNEQENKENQPEDVSYSKNPEETIVLPIIDKEIKLTSFYLIMAGGTLVIGIGLGFVLSRVLKKIIKKS